MPTYTVHAPPPKSGETNSAPERFVFVRDGFYFWAFLLGPLWLLWRRLWLALLGYVAVGIALGVLLYVLGLSSGVTTVAAILISLLVGLEASTLWRWTLARRGWASLGFAVGDDRENAERHFFARWVGRGHDAAPPQASTLPEPQFGTATRRAPASDVIGLFPEPGVKP